VNQPSRPGGTRVFQVRFGPEKASSHAGQWPNNLRLTGGGTVEVTADKVRISDARNAAAETERTFAMADIANVGFSGEDMIVALRTRSDQREVLVWLSSPEEARALLELLPRTTTAEFLERKRQHEKFRENLKVIAPRAPPVTPAIVGVNVALFLIMLAFGAGLTAPDSRVHLFFGANYGPLTWNGQEWRLLTAAFIHFGVIHLAFNMFALYNGGSLTERLFGSARFGVIYLLSALAGNVASGWWDASRMSAGASGAVFGVYGALLAYFARRPRDIPVDLLKSVSMGAATLLLYSLVMGAALPFIDNSAHIGGLLGGAISGLLLARPFNPEARKVARPWQVAAVVIAACAALVALAAPLL
jgi:rhomboid protease GluP